MTSAQTTRLCKTTFALAALAATASSAFSRPALADPAAFSAPRSAPPAASASPLLGPVERLPAEAYPAPTTRGLYGGSLWLVPDLHGEQWPYYPKTGIGVSGSAFVDFSVERNLPGEPLGGAGGIMGSSDSTSYLENTRFVLRATPTWSNGKYFVQGQTELVATQLSTSNNGIVWSADDAWIKFGKWKTFDFQFGRFQAWEVYHRGMGLDLYTTEFAGASGPISASRASTRSTTRSTGRTRSAKSRSTSSRSTGSASRWKGSTAPRAAPTRSACGPSASPISAG